MRQKGPFGAGLARSTQARTLTLRQRTPARMTTVEKAEEYCGYSFACESAIRRAGRDKSLRALSKIQGMVCEQGGQCRRAAGIKVSCL